MLDLNDQMKFEQEQQEQENESGLLNDSYHACHPLPDEPIHREQK